MVGKSRMSTKPQSIHLPTNPTAEPFYAPESSNHPEETKPTMDLGFSDSLSVAVLVAIGIKSITEIRSQCELLIEQI